VRRASERNQASGLLDLRPLMPEPGAVTVKPRVHWEAGGRMSERLVLKLYHLLMRQITALHGSECPFRARSGFLSGLRAGKGTKEPRCPGFRSSLRRLAPFASVE
jgi:hypothetical protein